MLKNEFIVYAHRGASEYAPENTMQSFYLGVQMGANGIETDVQLTKDKVLILFHDDTLDRVTDAKGFVKDFTYEELKKLSIKKGVHQDKIITFEEFVNCFGWRDLTFAIELKGDGVAEETARIINKYGIGDKCIITSFKFKELADINRIEPKFKLGYLVSKVDEEIISQFNQIKFYEICPLIDIIDENFVKEWNKKGCGVRAWGISDQEKMINAYKFGVSGMTVNFPDKLIEYIKNNEK